MAPPQLNVSICLTLHIRANYRVILGGNAGFSILIFFYTENQILGGWVENVIFIVGDADDVGNGTSLTRLTRSSAGTVLRPRDRPLSEGVEDVWERPTTGKASRLSILGKIVLRPAERTIGDIDGTASTETRYGTATDGSPVWVDRPLPQGALAENEDSSVCERPTSGKVSQ